MKEPKLIPDFGTDGKAIYKRQQYIKEHADYFTVVRKYSKMAEVKTLEEAHAVAERIHESFNDGQPLMIYAVYGPYDTWIENYEGKEDNQTQD